MKEDNGLTDFVFEVIAIKRSNKNMKRKILDVIDKMSEGPESLLIASCIILDAVKLE
jgi:hypothetical protein